MQIALLILAVIVAAGITIAAAANLGVLGLLAPAALAASAAIMLRRR
ncbi:hypothetical protein QCN27_00910 [Cereibacter sp. SYSU M97828]|nr:hypothetical protein [Cereibacter flavus]